MEGLILILVICIVLIPILFWSGCKSNKAWTEKKEIENKQREAQQKQFNEWWATLSNEEKIIWQNNRIIGNLEAMNSNLSYQSLHMFMHHDDK